MLELQELKDHFGLGPERLGDLFKVACRFVIVHAFNKWVLRTYCVLGTRLGSGTKRMNEVHSLALGCRPVFKKPDIRAPDISLLIVCSGLISILKALWKRFGLLGNPLNKIIKIGISL